MLLKEHEASYEALVSALENGESLGRCIGALEAALPAGELPSAVRERQRAAVAPYVVPPTTGAATTARASEFDLSDRGAGVGAGGGVGAGMGGGGCG